MNASKQIDGYIESFSDWRGDVVLKLRKLVHEADPEIVEEWKWETPVWTHKKMVCAVCAFKDHVKLNFFKGASLEDPDKLFNSGLEAKNSRSIDIREGDKLEGSAIKELVKRAVAFGN